MNKKSSAFRDKQKKELNDHVYVSTDLWLTVSHISFVQIISVWIRPLYIGQNNTMEEVILYSNTKIKVT